MRILPLWLLMAGAWNDGAFGTWRMSPARSTFAGDPGLKSFTLRIEPHASGEVFTMDRMDGNGRATTSSTILYFDGKPRDFPGPECSGSQSSRRLDGAAAEILRRCSAGGWIRFIRRVTLRPPGLVLDITEQKSDGSRFERRLLLERR
jgi:hypothetical protein